MDAPDASPIAAPPPSGSGDPDRSGPPLLTGNRILMIVSASVIALAVLALAFFLGTRLGSPTPPTAASTAVATATPSPTPTPTPSPTADPAAVPTAPAGPGLHEWTELAGGECIDPYTSPWERQFAVVDCAEPHHAQLLLRGTYPGDAAAPYPGEASLTSGLNLACSDPSVLDLGTAGIYSDLQLQPAYPASEAEWKAGDRSFFCFASRSGGDVLAGSLRPPA